MRYFALRLGRPPLLAFIFYFGANGNGRDLARNARPYIGSPLPHMHRISLGQPNVAINSCTLIEPTFVQRCVHADCKYVLPTKIRKIRKVEAKRSVSTGVFSYLDAVEHDHPVAENSVELDCDAPARIYRGKIEHPPVPARDRKSTRLNSSHQIISYAVFSLNKKNYDS